jgi:hypothetical protein
MLALFLTSYIDYGHKIEHTLYDGQKELKNHLKPDQTYDLVHVTTFSQTSFKYYFRDYPNVRNRLLTNLTKFERFTAGGSVVKDYELVTKESLPEQFIMVDVYRNISFIQYIFNEGGLVIYDRKNH